MLTGGACCNSLKYGRSNIRHFVAFYAVVLYKRLFFTILLWLLAKKKNCDLSRPVGRGLRMGAMFPLQIWIDPLGICRISKKNMLIIQLKHVRHPTTSTCCVRFTAKFENNSLLKMYVHERYFVQCYI
jgi:hypothetical protein